MNNKKIIVILDFTTGEVNKIEYYDLKKNPFTGEELENLICENGYTLSNIEWMTTTEEKISLDDDDDLFSGHCPECDDDDLEYIDGCLEYQELECSKGHIFEINNLGWEVSEIKKGAK